MKKLLITFTLLLLSSHAFAASGLYVGDFDGDNCFLQVEQRDGFINVSSMEDLEDGPKDRHRFFLNERVYEERINDDGVITFINLPGDTSDMYSWAFGFKNKTYSLHIQLDKYGTPVSYELESKKEGRNAKSLVECRNLRIIK